MRRLMKLIWDEVLLEHKGPVVWVALSVLLTVYLLTAAFWAPVFV